MRRGPLEEARIGVQAIALDQIKGPRVGLHHPIQQPQGRRDLIFPRPQGFGIQQHPQVLRHQRNGHHPVIVLNPIAPLGVNRTLQAPRTMPLETGVHLMPIQHRRQPAMGRRVQRLAPFETRIEVPSQGPHVVQLDQAGHATDRVGRGQSPPQPAVPPRTGAGLPQRVEAAQATEEHRHDRADNGPRGNLSLLTPIPNRLQGGVPP